MTARFRILIVIVLLLSGDFVAGALALYQTDTLKTTVFFHRKSETYDPDLRGNGERLRSFIDNVLSLKNDESVQILSISGFVGASVNGLEFDERLLCQRRISTLESELSGPLYFVCGQFGFHNGGQNWKRLEQCVLKSSGLNNREEVLSTIRNVSEKRFAGDTLADTRIFRLMKIDRGNVWSELEGRFFDEMDAAEIWCIYQSPLVVKVIRSDDPVAALKTQVPQLVPDPEDSKDYWRYLNKTAYWMAIRTNLLYDLALVPNIGIEFSVMKTFSIAATWEYAYWTVSSRNLIHKVYGGDLAVRRWFGHDSEWPPLTGHHVGLYGQIAAFDFAQGKSRLSVAPWQWAAGLEYGYTLPLGKGRLAFDFTVGIGYSTGDYNFWTLESGAEGADYYKWDNKSHYEYIGPTKAEISLVWRIGIK